MRIPPYYRNSTWQRFFGGVAIGGVISWLIFLYIFGVLQEKHTKLIDEQQDKIVELENDIKIWQDEYQEMNKKNIEQITVQKINVKITNWEKYNLDRFSVFEVEESVKDEDISMMLAKDIEYVSKSRELIKKIIHNKPVKINDKRYKLKVKEMVIFTTISIYLEIEYEK